MTLAGRHVFRGCARAALVTGAAASRRLHSFVNGGLSIPFVVWTGSGLENALLVFPGRPVGGPGAAWRRSGPAAVD